MGDAAPGTAAQPGVAPLTVSAQPATRREARREARHEARRGLVVALAALLLLAAFRLVRAAWGGP